MKKLTIKSLEIKLFRNLKKLKIINFDENYNEIIGENGTGKTNVLDAIRFMIFKKNEANKILENYKSIIDSNSQMQSPQIKLTLLFDNKEIILEFKKIDLSIILNN